MLHRHAIVVVLVALVAIAAGCGAPPRKRLESSPARISEVHFNPTLEQGEAAGEFIEIANVTKAPVDLSGWEVTGAGVVTLRAGTRLEPGKALVVCRDAAALKKLSKEPVAVAGSFAGKLKSKETVRLLDPAGQVADEVTYDAATPPAAGADGSGKSLQLAADGSAWQAAAATPGRR